MDSPISLSLDGAKFLADWEGYRSMPYNDSRNNATIGIGHLIHYGPVTPTDRVRYRGFNYQEALHLLQADSVKNAVIPLTQSLKVRLTQSQIDSLISLGFNCGPGSLHSDGRVMQAVNSKPKIWRQIEMGKWHYRVKEAILLWAHPVELTRRRQSEAFLFNTGEYYLPHNPFANGRD